MLVRHIVLKNLVPFVPSHCDFVVKPHPRIHNTPLPVPILQNDLQRIEITVFLL